MARTSCSSRRRSAGLTGAVVALALLASATASAGELLGLCSGDELCVSPESGPPAALTGDAASGAYSSPSASADGQHIAYVRFGSSGGPFVAGYRNGSPTRLLQEPIAFFARASPGGNSFAFFTRYFVPNTGGFSYYEHDILLSGANSALWSDQRSPHSIGWLGETVLITTGDSDYDGTADVPDFACTVAAASYPGNNPLPPCAKVVAKDATRDITFPVGSPDGRVIAATAGIDNDPANPDAGRRYSIALFDASTGALVRDLTSGPDDSNASFSPDGSQVAFTRGADTWVVPTAGGEPAQLVAGLTEASWYAPPAAGGGGGGGSTPPPTTPGGPAGSVRGRPAAPAAKLGVKGRRLTLKVRCRATGGCAKTTWTFRQGKRKRLVVRIPALKAQARRTLRVKLSKALVKRIGGRGLKLRVSGAGFKTKTVRLVRR